jgi:hypothetical protein
MFYPGSGMFYPGSGTFFHPGSSHFFIPDPTKKGMKHKKLPFFLLLLVSGASLHIKIFIYSISGHPDPAKIYPGSWGAKKHRIKYNG